MPQQVKVFNELFPSRLENAITEFAKTHTIEQISFSINPKTDNSKEYMCMVLYHNKTSDNY